jgi:hypothetical protein
MEARLLRRSRHNESFTFSSSKIIATIYELCATLEVEGIMDVPRPRDARSQRCRFFRESGRLDPATSDHKAGTTLDLDAKTAWTPETKSQRLGLEDKRLGRSQCLSSEYINLIVSYTLGQFQTLQPVSPVRFVPWLFE